MITSQSSFALLVLVARSGSPVAGPFSSAAGGSADSRSAVCSPDSFWDPGGRFAAAWQERQYAPWGVFLGDSLIGHGGLNFVPEFDKTEVLWAFHPDAWGHGYATEVARAALSYGFATLKLDLIFAITLPDNLASQAVMKRLGLTYRRRVDYKEFTDIVWYDIDRAAWLAR